MQAHIKQGFPLAPGMEIGYVIRDARKWEVDPERTASKFDSVYYGGLLEKAWGESSVCIQSKMNPLHPLMALITQRGDHNNSRMTHVKNLDRGSFRYLGSIHYKHWIRCSDQSIFQIY